MAEGSVATEQEISGQTKAAKSGVKEALKHTAQAALLAVRVAFGPGDEVVGAALPVVDNLTKTASHSGQREDPSRGQKPSEALAPVLPPNKQAELAEKSKPKNDPTGTV